MLANKKLLIGVVAGIIGVLTAGYIVMGINTNPIQKELESQELWEYDGFYTRLSTERSSDKYVQVKGNKMYFYKTTDNTNPENAVQVWDIKYKDDKTFTLEGPKGNEYSCVVVDSQGKKFKAEQDQLDGGPGSTYLELSPIK